MQVVIRLLRKKNTGGDGKHPPPPLIGLKIFRLSLKSHILCVSLYIQDSTLISFNSTLNESTFSIGFVIQLYIILSFIVRRLQKHASIQQEVVKRQSLKTHYQISRFQGLCGNEIIKLIVKCNIDFFIAH